jgi:hypothetical protein
MANRSNRRWESLSRAMAFEAAHPIRPRRADAHHGQEATSSTNRSDIRAQSHLRARDVIRSCYPGVVALIPMPDAKTGGPIHPRPECNALSTAARPPASVRGALPGGRPWITLQLTPIRPPPTLKNPSICACLSGGVHIRPTRLAASVVARSPAPAGPAQAGTAIPWPGGRWGVARW